MTALAAPPPQQLWCPSWKGLPTRREGAGLGGPGEASAEAFKGTWPGPPGSPGANVTWCLGSYPQSLLMCFPPGRVLGRRCTSTQDGSGQHGRGVRAWERVVFYTPACTRLSPPRAAPGSERKADLHGDSREGPVFVTGLQKASHWGHRQFSGCSQRRPAG